MGIAISDFSTADVLFQLNTRFGAGHPLREMVTIQKDFKVFSSEYSLKQAFRALHIGPADFQERRRWFVFLELLKKYASDQKDVNGHDRIRSAYQDNLESKTPLPVYTTTHLMSKDRRVKVTQGQPIIYETQSYLVISIPTLAKEKGQAARAAKKRRKGRKA
jgi:hypothetical protein